MNPDPPQPPRPPRPSGAGPAAHAAGETTFFQNYDNMTQSRASSLMKLSLHGPRNAADDLIEQLETIEGPRWMEAAWKKEPFASAGFDANLLLCGEVTVQVLKEFKEKGKAMVKNPSGREGYLCGLAAYYIAIASALTHHNTLITRTSRGELNQILIELASVAPVRWRDLFIKAAAR